MGRRFYFKMNKSVIKLRLRLFNLGFYVSITRSPDVETVGMLNLCKDGRFVLFVDYDNTFLNRVIDEVHMLQRKFSIGSVAVLSSSESIDVQDKYYGNYHVISFAKFRYREIIDMLRETSCDRDFEQIPQISKAKSWVLRVMPKVSSGKEIKGKPFLRRVLYAKTNLEMSYPHYKFLVNVYMMPELPRKYRGRFDRSRMLKIVHYQTTQGGWGLKDLLMPKSVALKNPVSNIKV